MIKIELINEFREVVNANNSWCFFHYCNNNKKNQWNCICSAMDWIQIAVEYISTHDLYSIKKQQSIELYAYLSCVDIIVESIEQLHRVICAENGQIFSKDNDCFPDNPFHEKDRDFFKSVRACFGAHPVNLVDPEDKDNKSAKRFASWSGGYFGRADFSVLLYSNKVDGKDIYIGIHYREIEKFAEKYYGYLAVLQEKIKKQYVKYCNDMSAVPIKTSDSTKDTLRILNEENKNRLNNEYYSAIIRELSILYDTPITCKENEAMVSLYLVEVRKVVDEIHYNLQNMEIIDLKENQWLPSECSVPTEVEFPYSKLVSTVLGSESLYSGELELRDYFQGYFTMEYTDPTELLVLINAALYKASNSKD